MGGYTAKKDQLKLYPPSINETSPNHRYITLLERQARLKGIYRNNLIISHIITKKMS